MRTKGWSGKIALFALFAIALTTLVQADTAVMDVNLGVQFSGNVAAGSNDVQARFTAAQGTLTVTVSAERRTNLVPAVVVRDGSGAVVTGRDQVIRWLPVGNLIHHVTLPASGAYTATIGGTAGSGGFTATVNGTPFAVTTAGLSGTVTDSVSSSPISGATVLAGTSAFATTNASGAYAGELSAGSYTMTFQADGYDSTVENVTLTAGTPVVLNVAMTPTTTAQAQVEASVEGDAVFGGTVTANVEVTGATASSFAWTQLHGPAVTITGADTAAATVMLGAEADFLGALIERLKEPAVTAEQLPPNVPLPPGEFPAGLQDRLQVVGVNPYALEESAVVTLEVEVVTDQGTFHDEVEIEVDVPWVISTGLRNVPIGNPVLVQAKESGAYNWTLITPSSGSLATLTGADTRYPYFTPDEPGLYQLQFDDGVSKATSNLQVYAGEWRGVIVDQVNDLPVSDTACTFCHNDGLAPDKFTEWEETGHANAFSDLLDTNTHFSSRCFSCHAVGYDPGSDAKGMDDVDDYPDFLAAGLLSNPGDNFNTSLDQFPQTARRMNIQCENCHGPNDSNAHGFAGPVGEPRVDISSDVCASCHGEPLRHGRFQQWQLSAHANYELAIDESGSGSCSRCHTGNGFLAWLPILMDDDPETDPTASISVTWTEDEAHPQTCVTCHDPHAAGTTSGNNTDATVRISGDTPPLIAGFTVTDAGKGAICMTCHNSRRGLFNDSTFDSLSTSDKSRAPHGSSHTDMLVGQNAFLVDVGTPGGHAAIENTCVTCHMKVTPPPDVLSYNQGGANHTFYASTDICSDCHSETLLASDVQNGVQSLLDQVAELFGAKVLELIDNLNAEGYTVDVNGTLITDVDQIVEIGFGETRGRQAISLVLTGGTEVGLTRLTDVDVLDGSMAIIGILYDFAYPALPKAGWNWNLVNNDGTKGVHNPFFASGALIAARDALLEVPDSLPADPAKVVPAAEPRVKTVRAGRDKASRVQD